MTLENTKNLKKQVAPYEKSTIKKVCGNLLTQSCHLLFYGISLIKVCLFLIC